MSRKRLSANTWFRIKATHQIGVVVSAYADIDGRWLALSMVPTDAGDSGYMPDELIRVRFRDVEIIEEPRP